MIEQVATAEQRSDCDEVTIDYTPQGRSATFALRLRGPNGKPHWLLFAGATGQMVRIKDEKMVEDLLHRVSTQGLTLIKVVAGLASWAACCRASSWPTDGTCCRCSHPVAPTAAGTADRLLAGWFGAHRERSSSTWRRACARRQEAPLADPSPGSCRRGRRDGHPGRSIGDF